jgi:hypothetical protein
MKKLVLLAALAICAVPAVAGAQESSPGESPAAQQPHLWDDLNADGESDGAQKAEQSEESSTPSQESQDPYQPTDDEPTP